MSRKADAPTLDRHFEDGRAHRKEGHEVCNGLHEGVKGL